MTQRHLQLKDMEIQLEPSHHKMHLIPPKILDLEKIIIKMWD